MSFISLSLFCLPLGYFYSSLVPLVEDGKWKYKMKLKLRQYLCNIKWTFRDERRPVGLAMGILMTELYSLFDFRLLSTECWLATYTQFSSWNGWLVLITTVISINHSGSGRQACSVIVLVFDWWAGVSIQLSASSWSICWFTYYSHPTSVCQGLASHSNFKFSTNLSGTLIA